MVKEFSVLETLALIKAGYNKKEIKAMAEAYEEPAETPAKESGEPEQEKEPEKEPDAEAVLDYKAMFEEMQNKNEELSKQLQIAQEANIAKDASGSQPKLTGQEALNEIFKNVIF